MPSKCTSEPQLEDGFVYLWALFAVALAGIVMAGAGQVWQVKAQREKEAQLLYVGEEFRKAIMSYYNTGTKQLPESLGDLLQDKRLPNIKHHLRKIYLDPVTNTAEWGLIEESSPGSNVTPNTNTNATSGNNPASNVTPAAGNNPMLATQSTPGSSSPVPGNNPTSGNSPAPGSAMPNSNPAISNINKRIVGVYSLSEKKPVKKDKFPERYAKFSEAATYRDWKFVYKPGEAGDSQKPATNQNKPNTPSGQSASPFAPQSSATGASASPFSSPSSSTGSASPFAAPSSDTGDTREPASGFSMH
ncbi:MAG: type II secretion system protein [Proteobacteria bacterium]|nr:type II secretion system protein [Pseudomonadota bacterium]